MVGTSENILYRAEVSLTLLGLKKTVYGPCHRLRTMAERDLKHAQTALNNQEVDKLLRALRDGSKCGRAEYQQIARGAVKDKGAKEKHVKEQTGIDQVKPSSDALFILSGQQEAAVQRSSGVPSSVFGITAAPGEALRMHSFVRRVDELRTWVADHMGRLPKQGSADATERALSFRYYRYKKLCTSDICRRGMVQAHKLLSWEKLYFDRVEEVVARDNSMRAVPSDAFMQRVDEIKTWVVDHMGRLPKGNSTDAIERALAARYFYIKRRCVRDLCTRRGTVRLRKYMPCEKAYFDNMEEIVHGYNSLGPLPSDRFMQRVDEIRTWVVDHMGQLPKQSSSDATERSVAMRYAYFKMRCSRDLRTSRGMVRVRKCLPWERRYFARIREVLTA